MTKTSEVLKGAAASAGNGILAAGSGIKTGVTNVGSHLGNNKGKYLSGTALTMFLMGAIMTPVALFLTGIIVCPTILIAIGFAALLAVGCVIANLAISRAQNYYMTKEMNRQKGDLRNSLLNPNPKTDEEQEEEARKYEENTTQLINKVAAAVEEKIADKFGKALGEFFKKQQDSQENQKLSQNISKILEDMKTFKTTLDATKGSSELVSKRVDELIIANNEFIKDNKDNKEYVAKLLEEAKAKESSVDGVGAGVSA